MRVTRTKLGGAVFIGLAGRLTVNADWEDLYAEACEISDPEVRGVFIDLEDATRLDCTGIGELVRLWSHVVAAGRAFGLVNLGRDQRSLLALLRIRQVFRIYGSRQDVLRTFVRVAPARSCDKSGIERHFRSTPGARGLRVLSPSSVVTRVSPRRS